MQGLALAPLQDFQLIFELLYLTLQGGLVLLGSHFIVSWPVGQSPLEFVLGFFALLLDANYLLFLPIPVYAVQVSEHLIDELDSEFFSMILAEVVGKVVGFIGDPVIISILRFIFDRIISILNGATLSADRHFLLGAFSGSRL